MKYFGKVFCYFCWIKLSVKLRIWFSSIIREIFGFLLIFYSRIFSRRVLNGVYNLSKKIQSFCVSDCVERKNKMLRSSNVLMLRKFKKAFDIFLVAKNCFFQKKNSLKLISNKFQKLILITFIFSLRLSEFVQTFSFWVLRDFLDFFWFCEVSLYRNEKFHQDIFLDLFRWIKIKSETVKMEMEKNFLWSF